MKYLEFINNLVKEQTSNSEDLVLFGQNIAAGSCLSGLTKGLTVGKNGKIINSTNSENSLCGFGFGLMINNIPSIFFMKQLDFLLLGIEHFVNTYNIIRNNPEIHKASFTIMPIVVDIGYQGPQSSLNNLGDFCSIACIDGYTITNKIDAERIIHSKLISPGFRIISISQRLFKEELIIPSKLVYVNNENTIFQYDKGSHATIICFNFTFPQGWELYNKMKEQEIHTSLFNVNSSTPTNWKKIIDDVKTTEKIIVLDDSKSKNLACDSLIIDIFLACDVKTKIILKKKITQDWLNPVSDEFIINIPEIINQLKN